ncbi:uncharacterized protein CTRU02_205861 [Colletotrichum truncatum]|uniref:Uncharacterized protein n=1 Tax=Colletotrichum truncatum TaxID=5467 RepID=A0ACC3Z581_COLTU|nr:uncharacterized protein CTRU02_04692 [Colletotrichum truncatum]KAF6795129.1 hypothetical protein CTRU02_04692 [Colletotrichum truncatum]
MPASEFLTTQTMGGYIVVLAIAGGLTYYYMADKNKAQAAKGVKPYVEPRKDNNAKKQRQAAFASHKPAADDKASSSGVATSQYLSNDPDEKIDNSDFAKRMATVKEGKKFDGKSSGGDKKKAKSVKQSRAVEKDEKKTAQVTEEKPSPPAQVPAVEAEEVEESSPSASPEVAPIDPSGVNDMLEPAAAGPSVLRLTGTDKEKPKAKTQKAPEKAETKKQRQNRQKAEAKKAAREEEEKDRRVKLEKQLRTARIASGTPAKDGSQFVAANGNKSAWTAENSNGASTNGKSAAVQPLDTFEAPAKNGTAAPSQAANNWISSLPSEEEQIERLKEEDEWNTVPTKSSKKAKKDGRAPSPEAAAAAAPAPAPAQSRPIAQAVQKPAASNGKVAKPAPSYGSFSALSTDDKEEEWDV